MYSRVTSVVQSVRPDIDEIQANIIFVLFPGNVRFDSTVKPR